MVSRRLVILAEGHSQDPDQGKTMWGVLRYRSEDVVAIVDSRRAGQRIDGIPVVSTIADALTWRPDTALVGVATTGGRLPQGWNRLVRSAIEADLDIESGLHEFLADDPDLGRLAAARGVELRDLRRPPADLAVVTGQNLEHPAQVVTMVGSDCAIGKMTVALELDLAAHQRGINSVFVPTGQTGIAIAGWGISVDAVVADFIAGAAERLVVEGSRRGGELLFVEGQGALSHPAYSGVTLGLIHGSAPHRYVLCHRAGASEIRGYPGHPLLSLPDLVTLHESISLPARTARVAAIAVNTAGLSPQEAQHAIERASEETGLPADDVVRNGADRVLDAVVASLAD